MQKIIRLETTAPFQGLAELVAHDEGLFEKEGLRIEWIDREKGVDKSPQLHITSHKDAPRFASHGSQLEQGKADLYNACEWGNYSRVEGTKVKSRQIGVPFFNGTHYLAIQMLEGFVPRDMIKLGRVPNGSPYRFRMLMDGTIDATTLTEPYITLAEKKGCRPVIAAFHHGTEVASERIDAETYSAFNRAVREAVRRINANKSAYMHYFIDYYKDKDPEIASLKVSDLRESRVYLVDPAPIPKDELERTYEWMKSWDFLETANCAGDLVDVDIQKDAHLRASNEPAPMH